MKVRINIKDMPFWMQSKIIDGFYDDETSFTCNAEVIETEPIPEKSEVEKVAEWFEEQHLIWMHKWAHTEAKCNEKSYRFIAQALMDAGVDVTPITKGMK